MLTKDNERPLAAERSTHEHKILLIDVGTFPKLARRFIKRQTTEVPPCALCIEITSVRITISRCRQRWFFVLVCGFAQTQFAIH